MKVPHKHAFGDITRYRTSFLRRTGRKRMRRMAKRILKRLAESGCGSAW